MIDGHMDRGGGARELYVLYHNAVVWLLVSFVENPMDDKGAVQVC
jgi:hypothetical protein